MANEKIKDINVDIETMEVKQKIESGKVLVLVLDGYQGKARMFEAVRHGKTSLQTIKGKAAEVHFVEEELF